MSSPLWYRARGTIFALIYLIGFAVFRGPRAYTLAGGTEIAYAVLLVMLAAYAVRVWGASYLQAQTVWDLDARNDSLVTDGPFRYTRNPLYLGNVLIAIAFGAFTSVWGWLFIVAANVAYVFALIRWETFVLRMRYGAQYDRYAHLVPVLFPRLSPAACEQPASHSLRQGLRAEIFSAALFAGMTALIFAGHNRLWIFIALFVAGAFAQARMARS